MNRSATWLRNTTMMRTMRNKWAVVGMVGALSLGIAACGGGDDDDGAATEADAGGDDDNGDAAVTIEGFEFTDVQSVAAGAEFTVENDDSATHTFTADDRAFDESLDGNATATITAPTDAGEYAFHCTIHPNMTGTLVVE